jgi:hypothetical protein
MTRKKTARTLWIRAEVGSYHCKTVAAAETDHRVGRRLCTENTAQQLRRFIARPGVHRIGAATRSKMRGVACNGCIAVENWAQAVAVTG